MKTRGKTTEKSNAKIMVKFVLILIASAVLGFAASMLVGYLTEDKGLSMDGMGQTLLTGVPFVFVLSNLVMAAVSLALYYSTKRQAARWDGEDEQIEQVERRLNYPLLFANTMLVLNFFFFAASVEMAESTEFGQQHGVILFPMCLVTFILGYVWILWVTNGVVKLEQQLNPEKRGNVFDTRFQKEWLESCDEAEKLRTYQVGYQGYKAGCTACIVMWVIAVFGQLWADTGIFPVVCVCVIWLAMMVRSMIAAIKLDKK